MEALAALSPTGGGWSGVPPVLTRVDDAAWLLRVGAGFGWLAMALLASALVWAWLALAAWLSHSPVGVRLSVRGRRLGPALALLHALAAALYGVWSFGYWMRPMGALAPLAHAGWGVLTAALVWVVGRARQQRRLSGAVLALVARSDNRNSRWAWARGGQAAWRSPWGKAGLAWLALAVAAVAHFPAHVKGWQESRVSAAQRQALLLRREITDRTGTHRLAQNVKAYDLWLRPSAFWSASWANPKTGLVQMAELGESILADAQRQALLSAGLTRAAPPAVEAGKSANTSVPPPHADKTTRLVASTT